MELSNSYNTIAEENLMDVPYMAILRYIVH
jgi:hypothetical protein